ncbi:15595_t:CDS:1, partial [Cetraspora pellucida]
MSDIVNKDKGNNIRKCTYVEDNNTSDQEQETQLDTANSHSGSGSYIWSYFKVLENKIYAKYEICKRKEKCIKYKFYSTTSNMIYHLD